MQEVLEKWVGVEAVAEHLGKSAPTVRKMAREKVIPGVAYGTGTRAFWSFKLSAVDAAYGAYVSSVTSSTPQNRKEL